MKTKRIIGLLLLTQLLWLGACNKSDETEIKNDNLLSETEIRDIGVKHNEALDFVFKNLAAQKESITKSSIDIETVIKNGLNEYCATQFIGEELDNNIAFSNKEVAKYFVSEN